MPKKSNGKDVSTLTAKKESRPTVFIYYHQKENKKGQLEDTLRKWVKLSIPDKDQIRKEHETLYPLPQKGVSRNQPALDIFNAYYQTVREELDGIYLMLGSDVRKITRERLSKMTESEKQQFNPYREDRQPSRNVIQRSVLEERTTYCKIMTLLPPPLPEKLLEREIDHTLKPISRSYSYEDRVRDVKLAFSILSDQRKKFYIEQHELCKSEFDRGFHSYLVRAGKLAKVVEGGYVFSHDLTQSNSSTRSSSSSRDDLTLTPPTRDGRRSVVESEQRKEVEDGSDSSGIEFMDDDEDDVRALTVRKKRGIQFGSEKNFLALFADVESGVDAGSMSISDDELDGEESPPKKKRKVSSDETAKKKKSTAPLPRSPRKRNLLMKIKMMKKRPA